MALAQAVVYLATAPKSNAAYVAYGAAMRAAKEHGSLAPPKHILNAPTKLMEQEGYGEGYDYDHDTAEGFSGQNYFPDGWRASSSTTRPSAASSARSGNGWSIGPSCARSAESRRHGAPAARYAASSYTGEQKC